MSEMVLDRAVVLDIGDRFSGILPYSSFLWHLASLNSRSNDQDKLPPKTDFDLSFSLSIIIIRLIG